MEKKKRNSQADLTRRTGPGTAHGGETHSFKTEICSRGCGTREDLEGALSEKINVSFPLEEREEHWYLLQSKVRAEIVQISLFNWQPTPQQMSFPYKTNKEQ